jgi:hypothetical protein
MLGQFGSWQNLSVCLSRVRTGPRRVYQWPQLISSHFISPSKFEYLLGGFMRHVVQA